MMNPFLPLDQAAARVARITKDPEFTAGRILQDGAEGQIPIYWRNSAQIWTRLSVFNGYVTGSDSAARFLQLNPHDVAKFETALQADVLSFELTDQDCDKLTKLFGSVNDADGNTRGFRYAVGDEPVTIHRDQLHVDVQDLMRTYAAPEVPVSESADVPPPPDAPAGTPPPAGEDPAPATTTASEPAHGNAPVVDTAVVEGNAPPPPPPTWKLIPPPKRIPGYRWPLYQILHDAYLAGKPLPKAMDVIDAWKSKPPPDIQVMISGDHKGSVEYKTQTGKKKYATPEKIQGAITRLLTK